MTAEERVLLHLAFQKATRDLKLDGDWYYFDGHQLGLDGLFTAADLRLLAGAMDKANQTAKP